MISFLSLVVFSVAVLESRAELSVFDRVMSGDGTYYGGNEQGGACQLAGVS